MTDQHTPDLSQGPYTLDDVWLACDWASHILKTPGSSIPMEQSAARVLQALLPPPKRPTLADMTLKERGECWWMQADVANRPGHYVVATPHDDDGAALLIDPYGDVDWVSLECVTPRPDLPRLEWPGNQKPAPALPDGWRLADHKDHGRVIVTRPEPDDDGEVCFVAPSVGFLGYGCCFCDPDELTYIDQEGDQ